jgi:transmembrane sensor
MSIEQEPVRPTSRESDRVETQAIEWLAKLRRPKVSSEEHAEFAIWLSASPVHKQIFDELLEVWDLSGEIQSRSTKTQSATDWRWFATAATLLVALSIWTFTPRAERYETVTGEQLAVVLDDGSHLLLNTQTTLQVELQEHLRHVNLLDGEVFFSVAKDATRPFEISTGTATIRVVGTSFNVRNIEGALRVEVLEGIVQVVHGEFGIPRELHAAEGLEYSGLAERQLSVASADTAPWREGKVVYRDVPLGDLLADLDRYLPGKVRLAEDSLTGIRVTAVLKLGDRSAMLDALASSLDLKWSEVSRDLVLISRG